MASELNINEQKFKTIALRGKENLDISDFEGLEFETFIKFTTQNLTLQFFELYKNAQKKQITTSDKLEELFKNLTEHHKEYKSTVAVVSDSGAHNNTWKLR